MRLKIKLNFFFCSIKSHRDYLKSMLSLNSKEISINFWDIFTVSYSHDSCAPRIEKTCVNTFVHASESYRTSYSNCEFSRENFRFCTLFSSHDNNYYSNYIFKYRMPESARTIRIRESCSSLSTVPGLRSPRISYYAKLRNAKFSRLFIRMFTHCLPPVVCHRSEGRYW